MTPVRPRCARCEKESKVLLRSAMDRGFEVSSESMLDIRGGGQFEVVFSQHGSSGVRFPFRFLCENGAQLLTLPRQKAGQVLEASILLVEEPAVPLAVEGALGGEPRPSAMDPSQLPRVLGALLYFEPRPPSGPPSSFAGEAPGPAGLPQDHSRPGSARSGRSG